MHILSNISTWAFLISSVFLTKARSDSTEPFARFEYKVSFKGPHLTQKDGSIPFWEYGGHAIAGDSYIRLTPSMTGKQGHAWAKKLAEFSNFRLDIAIRVSGVGRHGGDGLAIWFVDEKPDYNLPTASSGMFGGAHNWTGLAIVLDTYDNDGKNDNPKIGAFVSSNKALAWSHDTDGLGQDIGHCLRNYRNRPFPVRLRLQYLNKRLSLHVNNGVASEDSESDYELCFDKEGVDLPLKGYFGMTASTGGVSDDMDVYSFIVHSLSAKGAPVAPGSSSDAAAKTSEEERRKYEQEYEDYSKKLRDQIDAIAKSHREAVEAAGGAEGGAKPGEGVTEDETARQYRQIWEEQSRIRASIHEVSAGVANARHDLATSITELTQTVESARKEIGEVKNAATAAAAGGNKGGNTADAYGLKELKDTLSRLADKVDHLTSRHSELSERVGRSVQQQQTGFQQEERMPSGCATTYGLYCAIVVQTVALFGLGFFYLKRQDAAKKFY